MANTKRNSYHTQWERHNVRKIMVKISLQTEADMAEWMEKKPNKQGYIKSLIKADMEKAKKAQAE